ncbi:MAG: prolipoprotein diacylglyceryl transferase [Planctomycetaceae bacterium]|nr:prolipoprotein diacylglyceryl transferase [Planctomycetaceae bacterium]
MRQTLFYIPAEFFGLPLLGFNGLLFWSFLLWAALWCAWTVMKRGLNSDDAGFVVVILLVALVAAVFLPKIAVPDHGLPIRGYGTMLVLAFSTASGLMIYRGSKKRNIPSDMMFSLVLWCVVSGLLGARVFHIVEYLPSYLNKPNPIGEMLLFTEGGLVVYGGIIGGMFGTAIFFWRNRLSVLAMYDVMAPALLLGIAIGRLGCLMNGCCYGTVCDASCGIVFPPEAPAYLGQVFDNKTFVGGLKFAPWESYKVTTRETTAGSQANGALNIREVKNHGGCSCIGRGKREISKAEQERLDALPAMIAEVKSGSPAEQAGLKPGMIVQQIQHHDARGFLINDGLAKQFFYQLSLEQPNSNVTLTVMPPGCTTSQVFRFAMTPPEVLPVYPTQIMSFFGAMTLCGLVLLLERLNKRDGFASMLFLFLYSTGRFCVEFFRDDEAAFLRTGMSIAQNVSLVIFVLGIVVAIFIFTRPPRHALAERFSVAVGDTPPGQAASTGKPGSDSREKAPGTRNRKGKR